MNECEHVCGNYDDDDTVCRTCTDNRVQRQQSCYVKPEKPEKPEKPDTESIGAVKMYRIIAEDGDIVVLKEVRSE